MWLKPQSREILIPFWKLFHFWHWKELDRPGKVTWCFKISTLVSHWEFESFPFYLFLICWCWSTKIIVKPVQKIHCYLLIYLVLSLAFYPLIVPSSPRQHTNTQFWHFCVWNCETFPFLTSNFSLLDSSKLLIFLLFYFLLCSVKHTFCWVGLSVDCGLSVGLSKCISVEVWTSDQFSKPRHSQTRISSNWHILLVVLSVPRLKLENLNFLLGIISYSYVKLREIIFPIKFQW
jgi:hypothetical protein